MRSLSDKSSQRRSPGEVTEQESSTAGWDRTRSENFPGQARTASADLAPTSVYRRLDRIYSASGVWIELGASFPCPIGPLARLF